MFPLMKTAEGAHTVRMLVRTSQDGGEKRILRCYKHGLTTTALRHNMATHIHPAWCLIKRAYRACAQHMCTGLHTCCSSGHNMAWYTQSDTMQTPFTPAAAVATT
jgi:hypothetical protein